MYGSQHVPEQQALYVLLELCTGGTLADLVDNHPGGSRAVSVYGRENGLFEFSLFSYVFSIFHLLLGPSGSERNVGVKGSPFRVDHDVSVYGSGTKIKARRSLQGTRKRNRWRPDRVPEPTIVKAISDIAEGLMVMHMLKPPLQHRDLKLENVPAARGCGDVL